MNLRRGLLFAAIHLAIAVPIVVSIESRDADYVRDSYVPHAPLTLSELGVGPSEQPANAEGTVKIDLCGMIVDYPTNEHVLRLANIPALTASDWRILCPPRWSLAGILGAGLSFAPTPASLVAERKVDIGFIALIAIQWLIVGGFPLRPSTRLVSQPEWFITFCGVAAALLVWIPPVSELARLPALFAGLAWLWLGGLVVWRAVRRSFRFVKNLKAEKSS